MHGPMVRGPIRRAGLPDAPALATQRWAYGQTLRPAHGAGRGI